ncbi:MAG: radical SAM protein [Acidobacteria bacterium RIFCSPLOWO2_12_FULL_59_11]|nr:MAG: radical SAM protein [Acidobacteria bacterium RIFCSPLOWO2_12_FULL_59_11]
MTCSKQFRRKKAALHRRLRTWWKIGKGLLSTRHPLLVHLIPVRRCNLSCTYCNEYDDFSAPVPTAEMLRRVDRLDALGTSVVTISGGEPTLHPDLDEIIRRIRHHGMIAGLITNGYFLIPERIERLNRAGLEYMQISIDNVTPDEVSKKSLKVLDRKLQWLGEYAEFHVNINSVLGGGIRTPEDALVIARRSLELGLTSSVGIIHDGSGQLRPLGAVEQKVYQEIKALQRQGPFRLHGLGFAPRLDNFQEDISNGQPHEWRCRAGARYLYICEDGLVHYCSQQRGYPGVPLEEYTPEDIGREYFTQKSCAPHCTISCVQQIAMVDNWRDPQNLPSSLPQSDRLVQLQSPVREQR